VGLLIEICIIYIAEILFTIALVVPFGYLIYLEIKSEKK